MTFSSKITFQYDCKSDYHTYNEVIPEENITITFPSHELGTVQLFKLFRKFMLAIGHHQPGIDDGALSLVFSEERQPEDVRKIAEEYDLIMSEDHYQKLEALEKEIIKLKAKLSRFEQPDNPNYTDDEMEAMSIKYRS